MPDWHHAPTHRLAEAGAYCVTAATYLKQHYFRGRKHLEFLQQSFFDFTERFGWHLHAWSFFPNHYHFVGFTPTSAETLSRMLNEFHSATARELNRMEGTPGRKIWFQFWDTQLTITGSYLARLKYVTENPVHHRIVERATSYPWCSASWFEQNATNAFRKAVTCSR